MPQPVGGETVLFTVSPSLLSSAIFEALNKKRCSTFQQCGQEGRIDWLPENIRISVCILMKQNRTMFQPSLVLWFKLLNSFHWLAVCFSTTKETASS